MNRRRVRTEKKARSLISAVGCGNDFMQSSYAPVPEQVTMLLFGIGLAGTGIVGRFRRKA